jgi:uncharacterized protein YecE (DUF72 family)
MTHFYVGTSGYSYPKWKGMFYPAKLPLTEMLTYYAERFGAVELNNTFYRMPTANELRASAKQTPATFQFAVKAPQILTHRKRLKECKAEVRQFLRAAAALKTRLGPLLFQLPPNFKQDLPRLDAFLELVAEKAAVAFEFRHASWFDKEVFACLRAHGCALCLADMDDLPVPKLVSTANWGYLRLRRTDYTAPQLRAWIKKLRAQQWEKAYVFFRHEDTGSGPRLGARFLELAGFGKGQI